MVTKKYSILILCLVLVLFAGCAPDNHNNLDNSIHSNADLSDYSSFSMVSSFSEARSMGDIDNNILLGQDKNDKEYEEVAFFYSSGDKAKLRSIKKVGPDYLLLVLDRCSFVVDIKRNKYVELKGFDGNNVDSCVFQTDKGIILLRGMYNDTEILLLDFEKELMVPLTNNKIDEDIQEMYASKSGHFITKQWSDDEEWVYKFYSENGNPPIKTNVDISSYSMAVIGSPDVDFLFSPINGIKYILTNEGIKEVKVEGYEPYDNPYQLHKVFVKAMSQKSNPINIYSVNTGIMGIIYNGKLRVSEIKNGDVVFNEYVIPFDSESIFRSLLKGDYLIYDFKDGSEIRYWNFKTGDVGSIFKGSYGSWNSSGDGIFYTRYNTATNFETVYYDIEEKTSKVISDSNVEVVEAVWYEY